MHPDLPFSRRLTWVIVAVAVVNIVAGIGWVQMARFGGALWGIGLLAWLLGARHAFDVDHIAAIDNVTRRLRHDGRRPAAVGLFFSLGHSTVVIAATVALVLGGEHLRHVLPALKLWGTAFGTGISASFLIVIGVANVAIVRQLWRQRKKFHRSDASSHDEIGTLLENRGAMARVMRFAYRRIDHSRKMYLVGLLFGLGFDTASEIILLALTAVTARQYGLNPWSLLALPLLFAAGMTLMDTVCGLGMLRLYDWSIAGGEKTWAVNVGVTFLSVLLAFGTGFAELSHSFQWSMTSGAGLIAGTLAVTLILVAARRYPYRGTGTRPQGALGKD